MCRVSFNYDEKKKNLAKKYLRDYGLSMTDAISIFLDAVVMNKGMPNADALEDAEDIRMASKEDDELKEGKAVTYSSDEVYKRLGI